MPTYAIGDIQGCCTAFLRLLDAIRFEPAADRLWLVGDLVNRGSDSLRVLREVRALGATAITVLGNHDLHLLAVAEGVRPLADHPSLRPVLEADDCEELLAWLRRLPLVHYDAGLGYTLVHAGLPREWNTATALTRSAEVGTVLAGPGYAELLEHMYGSRPDRWSEQLAGYDRLRFIINAFTRMRYYTRDGRLELKCSAPPSQAPAGFEPWFRVAGRASRNERIVFGHWSTLPEPEDPALVHLDTGCVWGGVLTAVRLEPQGVTARYSVDCGGG
jgi:bis(5'-nucleosyl)-tetraphosphatase (symmetrical)